MSGIELTATIATLTGMFLLSEGIMPLGFAIGAIANIFWLWYGNNIDSKGIMVVNLILLIININGLT